MPIIAGRASAAYGAGFGAVTTAPYDGPYGAFDALALITLTSTATQVILDGIPTGYRHLQLREQSISTRSDYAIAQSNVQFNRDTTSSYSMHYYYGDGSGVTVAYDITSGHIFGNPGTQAADANGSNTLIFGTSIMDIFDYSDNTKFKSTRTFSGVDLNGSINGVAGRVGIASGIWRRKDPVMSITVISTSTPYKAGSRFALYGVK